MLDVKFWQSYFTVYDVLNRVIPYQELLNRFVDLSDISGDEVILDAGAGTGNLSVLLSSFGTKVFALDNSSIGLDILKSKSKTVSVCLHSLIDKLPFPDEYFDVIVSNNVIYTIDKKYWPSIFAEFYRTLRPGGMVIVSNIKEGWNPLIIYIEHVHQSIRKKGFFATTMDVFKMIIPTVKMFYFNYIIRREGSVGNYNFIRDGEQACFLRAAGFTNISDDPFVYANQAILNIGYKDNVGAS